MEAFLVAGQNTSGPTTETFSCITIQESDQSTLEFISNTFSGPIFNTNTEAFLAADQNTSGPTTGNPQWFDQNPPNSMMHTFSPNYKINWDAQASGQIAPRPITENSQKSSKFIPRSMMNTFQHAKIF